MSNVVATAVAAAFLFGCSGSGTSSTGASTGGKLQTLVHAGDASGSSGESVAVDADGNRVVSIQLNGTIDLGSGPLQGEAVIAKIAPAGNVLWAHAYAADLGQPLVTLDAAGNVYVGSSISLGSDAQIDFGNGPVPVSSSTQGFLLALDADGRYRWIQLFKPFAASFFSLSAIAADAVGNVWMAGAFSGGMNLGSTPFSAARQYSTTIIARLSADGAFTGTNVIQCPSCTAQAPLYVSSIATDAAGNALFLGSFSGAVDFKGTSLGGYGDSDVFFAKYGPDVVVSAKDVFGGPADDRAGQIAVAPDGTIAFSGHFGPSAIVAGKSVSTADVVVATIDASGNYGWATRMGTDGGASGVAIAPNGDVALITECSYVGGGSITARAGADTSNACIVKLDATGNAEWGGVIGGSSGGSYSQGVAFDPKQGNVVLTGTFTAGADFGNGPVATSGTNDFFLATYTP